jgi:hypothetical protein
MQVNVRLGRLKCCLREAYACSDSGERERGKDFTGGGDDGTMVAQGGARRGKRRGFK